MIRLATIALLASVATSASGATTALHCERLFDARNGHVQAEGTDSAAP